MAGGCVVAALVLLGTVWMLVAALSSFVICVVILLGYWGLFRESLTLSLDAVPPAIDRTEVESYLSDLPGVVEVHDLHIWGLSTTESALPVHLVCANGNEFERLLPQVCAEVEKRFKIGHATIQFETPELARLCGLRPAHVV